MPGLAEFFLKKTVNLTNPYRHHVLCKADKTCAGGLDLVHVVDFKNARIFKIESLGSILQNLVYHNKHRSKLKRKCFMLS